MTGLLPERFGLGQLRPRVLPRRFHAYALGTVKSGTHSWFGMFATRYRAFHELDAGRLVRFALEVERGEHGAAAIDRFLRERGRRFRPELHASHLDVAFVDRIAAVFPEARFLVATRSPQSWLDSWINHELGFQPRPAVWQRWRLETFPRAGRHPREERLLAELGLASLESHLRYWCRCHDRILDAVAPERLLLVPTLDLRRCTGSVARFLDVSPATLDPARAHAFATRQRFGVLDHLPPGHLDERVATLCAATLARLERASANPALARRLREPAVAAGGPAPARYALASASPGSRA